MNVLVADRFEQSGLDALTRAGCNVVYRPELQGGALARGILESGAEVLVVRSTAVDGPMLEAASLSLIVRAGAGYNTIDVATASTRGIYVSNCPGRNSIAVAELAFGLILALDRRIPDNVVELRRGIWNKKEFAKARGLFGRTIGIIGWGNIGQEMASRARAFGMPLVVWSRRFTNGGANAHAQPDPMTIVASPQEAAGRCDVLSLHLALTSDTRGLVDSTVLDQLKPGSYLINTARAELVDQAALERAIRERNIRVGLDVFASEPDGAAGDFSDPIVTWPGVYGTHHIGASTDQAQEAVAAEAVRIVTTYKQTGKVLNVVNLARKTPATHMLIVRHRDRPGVLAHVFERLRAGNINVQETENVIFEGAEAAVARINVDGEPSPALLATIQHGNGDILDLRLVTI
jgi:D-3-phosphoglycerate dehydrogenase